MNRSLSLVIFVLFIIQSAKSQSDFKTLNEASQKISKSLVDYDFDTYCSMIYPKIVELSGGLDTYIEMTKSYKNDLAAAGMMITKSKVDTISNIVDMGEELQCFVKLQVVNKMGENYFEGPAYLLAISSDKGEHWSFVDLETFDEAGLIDFVQSYDSSKLKYPTISEMLLINK